MLDNQSVVVSMDGVGRRYGDVEALENITLQVPRGAILGVIGPSGSGKTTMIRLLTGTLDPTHGSLRVLGQEPRKFTRRAREGIGYMPQHFVLYEELTAAENVSFVASLFGLLWPRRGRRVREVLELVRLPQLADRSVRSLSGGQQQRIALARALALRPPVLLLDEPTQGLDAHAAAELDETLAELQADNGFGTVIFSHDVRYAFGRADKVYVMAGGRIIESGSCEEVRASNNPVVHRLLNRRGAA